jgi:hypothetical protein
MRLHLLSARRLSDELAAGRVTTAQQAAYMGASFIAWLIPSYFNVSVTEVSTDTRFVFGLYWMEFAMLVLMNVAGPFYCLRQCRVVPERHFLVDFTCLYAPVAIVVLTVTWAVFHAIAWTLPRAFAGVEDYRAATYFTFRLYDVARWLTVVGQVFLIYLAVGRYMRRTAGLRA